MGRLTQFTDGAGKVLRYTYDSVGNLTTLTYPDQKHVTYRYDAARRLISVTDWANRLTSYTYDADSRVTAISRPDQSVEAFTYDAAGQITRSNDVAPGSNLLHNIHYTFDADGKITDENISPAPGIYHPAALTLTVDADNRLATINQQTTVYDNNGNLTHATIPGSAISALSYDARNRLVHAGGLTYTYDAENRRTSVASTAGTTNYVINPNAGLDQILVKTAPNGTVTRYVYGLGLIGEETGSTFTTYHYDHRGSTTALTRINGSVIQRFSYGPNGEPVGFDPATAPTQFLYGGRYGVATDTNGLCHMRARYYLPAISRFLNQDILLGRIESGISLNRFAYANGDPIDKNDPFGLAAQPLDYSAGTVDSDTFLKSVDEPIAGLGLAADLSVGIYGENSGAFRDFNIFTNEPGLNSVGDLRGMVLDAQSRQIFEGIEGVSKGVAVADMVLKGAAVANNPTPENAGGFLNSVATYLAPVVGYVEAYLFLAPQAH